jgi:PTS system nitrogen regulatory IIA component
MITADLIIPHLPATSKKQAFQVIAQQTAPLFHGDPEQLLSALLDRERIGSTGIGNGVAIPHIKVSRAPRMYGILAHLDSGVDYDALDGEPVDIIFMLIAPTENKTTQHLKMLAYMSRFLKDPANCAAIRAGKTKEDLMAVLSNWIKRQAA